MEHVFATDNALAFSRTLTPGRCNGLSSVWARATLIYGGVRYPAMLDDGHVNISQQAYEQQNQSEVGALEAAGLDVTDRFELKPWAPATAAATMATKIGTYFVDVKGTLGGHAIGFRNDTANGAPVYEFFDPNFGLYRTKDLDDFRTSLVAHFTAGVFPQLRDKMRFFKVTRA